MPRRVTLTDRQREALLHLPVDQGELLRHYTLSDEDLGHIRQRRRAHSAQSTSAAPPIHPFCSGRGFPPAAKAAPKARKAARTMTILSMVVNGQEDMM